MIRDCGTSAPCPWSEEDYKGDPRSSRWTQVDIYYILPHWLGWSIAHKNKIKHDHAKIVMNIIRV